MPFGSSRAQVPLPPSARDEPRRVSDSRKIPSLSATSPMSSYPVVQFPAYRPRRLRQSPVLRQLVRETQLNAGQLVLPLFVRSGRKLRRPIAAMPGVFQLSPDELLREAARAYELGVPAVLVFGIPDRKDLTAFRLEQGR